MKAIPMRAVKRDLNVISLGLRNGIRFLFKWLNGAPDKDATKKRLLITVGVPAGFIIVGSEYPAFAVSGAFLLFFGAVFWFARVEEQQMTIESTDFTGPFQADGKVMDFPELLAYLAHKHPDATLQQLADVLCDDFWGPDLTDAQLASQMRLHRVRHRAVPIPSPAPGDVPLAKGENAGHDLEKSGSGENQPKQGSGKAWLAMTGLASKVKSYAGSSPKEEKSSGQAEEPSRGGMGEEQGRADRGSAEAEDGAPDDAHPEGGGQAPVPDAGGRQEDPGGVPDQGDGRDSSPDEAMAEGA